MEMQTVGKHIVEFEIDDEDFPVISKYKWRAYSNNGKWYIIAKINHKEIRLQRLLLNAIGHNEVDHIDGNTLNNKKNNLRICSHAQNMHNCQISRSNTSGYKGVTWDKNRKLWAAKISVNAKCINLGRYSTPQLAHEAYYLAAIKYFGEYARAK